MSHSFYMIIIGTLLIGLIVGFLCSLYRFNYSNKFIDVVVAILNFINPVPNCDECRNTRVLFFPDTALPCNSVIETLMSSKTAKCRSRRRCKYLHRGDKSSLIELYLELNRATKSIDICMYLITIRFLAEFLVYLKEEKGIIVRVITDSAGHDEYKINNQAADLQKAGIAVRTKPNQPTYQNESKSGVSLMHNKFVVLDNKTVILGSFNWTMNATLNNDEAIIITSQKSIVFSFLDKFRSMWSEMRPVTDRSYFKQKDLDILQ